MSQIGRYTVVRKTGSHGVAELYEAFDPVMNRPVTICLAERPTDPGIPPGSRPVLFDSRQVANLDHPNIVRVLACEEDENRPYFVMEKVEGRSLDTILSEGGNLPQDQVLEMVKQAALALDHIHSKGLVHHGLTARKVFLDAAGQVKLDGFEMARPARLFDPTQLISEIISDANRLPYVAPELLRGDPVDGRADQFSLAAIACQALSGRPPFQSSTPIDLLCRVLLENPEVRPEPGAPAAAARVLERALAKSPSERFSSCGSLAAAFDAALTGKAAPREAVSSPAKATVMAPQPMYSTPEARGPRIWLWVGLFALASVLAVVLAVVLAHQGTPAAGSPAKLTVAPAPATSPQPVPKAKSAVPAPSPAKATHKAAAPAASAAPKPAKAPAPAEKKEEDDAPGIQATKPKPIIQ
jgi:serine/threonine protein kinase